MKTTLVFKGDNFSKYISQVSLSNGFGNGDTITFSGSAGTTSTVKVSDIFKNDAPIDEFDDVMLENSLLDEGVDTLIRLDYKEVEFVGDTITYARVYEIEEYDDLAVRLVLTDVQVWID